MNKDERELSDDEKSRVNKEAEETFRERMKDVDEEDVKEVLEEGESKARDLLNSSVGKFVKLGKQTLLLWKMLRDWWNDKYELPWKSVTAVTAALLYFINPMDVIPDFIPGIGYLDDITVVTICIQLVQDDLREYAEENDISLKEYGL